MITLIHEMVHALGYDYHDHGDTGYGYTGPEFVYHPEQKFAEEDED